MSWSNLNFSWNAGIVFNGLLWFNLAFLFHFYCYWQCVLCCRRCKFSGTRHIEFPSWRKVSWAHFYGGIKWNLLHLIEETTINRLKINDVQLEVNYIIRDIETSSVGVHFLLSDSLFVVFTFLNYVRLGFILWFTLRENKNRSIWMNFWRAAWELDL